jgi:hypothetical protein
VEGIRVEGSVPKLETATDNFFSTQNTLSANLLEARVDVLLNFVEILDTTGGLENDVSHDWLALWTKVPDLTSFFNVPAELICQKACADLEVLVWEDLGLLNSLEDLWGDGARLKVKTVVLVGRLGHNLLG